MLSFTMLAAFLGMTAATASTYSQGFCITSQGTKSVSSVPSKTIALTLALPALATTTVTPSITLHPSTQTTTSTIFTTSTSITTAALVTDTFTSTTTLYTTTTLTSSSTSTITVSTDTTTTTSAPVSTIAAAAGFTPLASGLPAGNTAQTASGTAVGGYRKRSSIHRNRQEGISHAQRSAGQSPRQLYLHSAAQLYPTSVVCKKLVEIVSTKTLTRTASKTATIIATTPTSTVITTSTVVTVSTSVPVDASTIVTESTTSTLSTTTIVIGTTTTTSTNTVVVASPTATFYAACASNNLVVGVNGQAVNYVDSGVYNSVGGPSNAYDCCAACQQADAGTCSAFAFSVQRGGCYFVPQSDGSCNSAESNAGFVVGTAPNDDVVTVGNTACGYFAYDGTFQ